MFCFKQKLKKNKKTNVPKVSGSKIRFQDSKMSEIFNIKKGVKVFGVSLNHLQRLLPSAKTLVHNEERKSILFYERDSPLVFPAQAD